MKFSTCGRFFRRTAGVLLTLLIMLGSTGSVQAEKNWDNWKKMDVPPAPALSPKQQKQTFRIAPGFKIELVAAEPQIVDPVAIRWDAAGRLWAVEMRGFMPNVKGEGEQKPVGKIAVLEDKNGDGYFESRTTFLDHLVMPRAVALVEGGVLVAEPPNLWYCRDTDGDLKSDKKTKVAKYAKQGPVEHTENGLRRTIDNWLHNAKSNRKFRFDLVDGKPRIIEKKTKFRGQWGIAQDSYGRLYHNNNSAYLPGVVSAHDVHTIRVNPGINRGYQPQMLKDDGRLKRPTAVSGQVIYRGDQFPKRFREDAFVPEPGGNVMAYFDLKEREGKGKRPRGEHIVWGDPDWGHREFLASKDERFRPVNVENGPDGAMYVVDMYRGILQHKVYVTKKYLKPQILARGLDEPVGLGRIWRIVSTKTDQRKHIPNLYEKSSQKLVELLNHRNGWHRDWAQRLLIRRNDQSVAPDLRALAKNGDWPIARLHAFWTLQGMGKLNAEVMDAAKNDAHAQVRKAAKQVAQANKPPRAEDSR
jgi:glucose/arabinose dehydrogenase